MMQAYIEKANVLIEAVPYIQEFRGALVVVKVGGSVQESADNLLRLLSDIAFMRTVGIKVILVHGGGKAISRAMETAGIAPNFVQGLRVTDEATIEVVENVIKHQVNANILQLLNKNFHVLARPLHGDWVLTVRKVLGQDAEGRTLDWGYVGEPTAVKTDAIAQMVDAGEITEAEAYRLTRAYRGLNNAGFLGFLKELEKQVGSKVVKATKFEKELYFDEKDRVAAIGTSERS
jgi:acetylglutamate kinase